MSKLIEHAALMLGSVLLAIPVVGFVAGVVICEDCGSNPAPYLLMGVIHAFITTLAMGNIWVKHDEFISAWPYIVPAGLAIYVVLIASWHRIQRKSQMATHIQDLSEGR